MAASDNIAPQLAGHGLPGVEVRPREGGSSSRSYPVLLDGRRIGRVMNGSGGWTIYLETLGPLRERVGFDRNGHVALRRLVEAERARRTEASA